MNMKEMVTQVAATLFVFIAGATAQMTLTENLAAKEKPPLIKARVPLVVPKEVVKAEPYDAYEMRKTFLKVCGSRVQATFTGSKTHHTIALKCIWDNGKDGVKIRKTDS